MRSREKVLVHAIAALVVAAGLGGASSATGAGTERVESFAGSCSVKGDVTFSPPVSNNQERDTTYGYLAKGTCSGELDGQKLTGAPVTLRQSGRSRATCSSAHTLAPGRGSIDFGKGRTVAYTLEFTSTATEIDFHLRGERSGTAGGHGTFLTDRTPPSVVAECSGSGTSRVPMDMTISTETPLVSGGRRDAGSKPAGLSLSVSPRRVAAGHRTAFRFRVRAGRHPVRGAAVRLAGHRARTNRRGRVKITATLRGAGRHRARARKRGLRSATATVTVEP